MNKTEIHFFNPFYMLRLSQGQFSYILSKLRPAGVAILFSGVSLMVHMIFATNYELHRDEYLYIALGRHLDWGYASVPPFIGFISWLVSVSGLPVDLGLKFMAALAGAFTAFLTIRITVNLGGKTWAVFLAGTAYLFSIAYNRTAWLFQPVVFDVMFWTIALYFFIELIRTQEPKHWIPLGLFCGLGMLNKYTMAFLITGMVFTLLINSNRRLFFTKSSLIGGLLGVLVFYPNLVWQIQHKFPVVRHMMQLKENQLDYMSPGDFIFNQLLMNLHALPLWITGLIGGLVLVKTSLSKPAGPERALFAISILYFLTVGLFLLGGGKAYYTLGMYPALFATGAFIIGNYGHPLLKWIVLFLVIALSLPLMPLGLPIWKHERMIAYCKKVVSMGGENILKWEDGRVHDLPQDYADMTGWKELADLVEKAYTSLSTDEKKKSIIYCENYGQAGAVVYYSEHRIPDPVSFSDNFLLWAPDSIQIETLIYVNDEIEEISTHFQEVVEFGRIKNPYARETGLPVYICRRPVDINAFYTQLVKDLKEARF